MGGKWSRVFVCDLGVRNSLCCCGCCWAAAAAAATRLLLSGAETRLATPCGAEKSNAAAAAH